MATADGVGLVQVEVALDEGHDGEGVQDLLGRDGPIALAGQPQAGQPADELLGLAQAGPGSLLMPGDDLQQIAAIESVADDFNRLAESLESKYAGAEAVETPPAETAAVSDGVTVPG